MKTREATMRDRETASGVMKGVAAERDETRKTASTNTVPGKVH